MLFNSLIYLSFFIIVFILYYLVSDKYRYIVLLIASYIFYGYANINYIAILLGITTISYFSGYIIAKTDNVKTKKVTITISIIISIGILIYFKYLSFIVESLNMILKQNIQINNILVPLGISFFTLQAITYPIDLYRKQQLPERNFLKFALFVAFFPQLLSGPIGKSKEMLPQYSEKHKFNGKEVYTGLIIVLYGYFQKLVIADLLALGVNNVYNNLYEYQGIPLLLIVFLYSFQIYFDFASYSNIARGSAKMLGYNLTNNFNSPYLADSIKTFWGRWHISLSTWFKEYLYFPLGGNRKGKVRTYINLLIVFLVSGLWHGAYYTYIIWGLLHGIYQILERIINKKSRYKVINIIITFILVTFAWIFFRANTLADAIYVIKNMFNINFINIKNQIINIGFDKYDLIVLSISMISVFIMEVINEKRKILTFFCQKNDYLKAIFVLMLAFTIIIFGHYGPGFDNSQFIYLGY